MTLRGFFQRSSAPAALLLVPCCLFALVVIAGPSMADSEPNDGFDGAEAVKAGRFSGSIDRGTDRSDYYKFQAGEGDVIELEMWPPGKSGGWDIKLFNSTKKHVGGVNPSVQKTNRTFYYTAVESPVDIYYLALEGYTSDYVFHLRLYKQDDARLGTDAPRTFDDAPMLPLGVIVHGYFGDEDTTDVYALNFTAGQKIKAELKSESDASYVKAMVTHYTSVLGVPQIEFTSEVTYGEYWTASESRIDMYYVVVHVQAAPGRLVDQGSYTIQVTLEDQDDAGTSRDAIGGSDKWARPIETGEFTGELGHEDSEDRYEIRVHDEMGIRVAFAWFGPDTVTLGVGRMYGIPFDSINSSDGNWGTLEMEAFCFDYWGEDWEIFVEAPRMGFVSGHYEFDLELIPMVDEEPPVIELVDIGKWKHGEDMDITMNVYDNKVVHSISMHWRMVGDELFNYLNPRWRSIDNYTFEIPGENVTESGVEWYVHARDRYHDVMFPENGNVTPKRFPPLVDMGAEIPVDPEFGKMIVFKFQPECEYGITMISFHYRMNWSGTWCSTAMSKIGSVFILDISEEVTGGTLEYYAVVKDEWGFKTYYGTEDAPHELAITEEKPPKKDDSPGFGGLAALMAFVLAVLTARYRSSMLRRLT